MIRNQDRDIDDIHYYDKKGIYREITYVYYRGKRIWELIIGFIFTKNGYSIQSKDGYIIKCKDQ